MKRSNSVGCFNVKVSLISGSKLLKKNVKISFAKKHWQIMCPERKSTLSHHRDLFFKHINIINKIKTNACVVSYCQLNIESPT